MTARPANIPRSSFPHAAFTFQSNWLCLVRRTGVQPLHNLSMGLLPRSGCSDRPSRRPAMKKTLLALAAAASIGAAALAAPSPADAGAVFGCAVRPGVAGGFIAGALIGSAAAPRPPHLYGPPPAERG